ncbi:MAG: alpha-L-rhamnosidase C-terminal domain-containing protein [Verrucomicrobiota bacterium]
MDPGRQPIHPIGFTHFAAALLALSSVIPVSADTVSLQVTPVEPVRFETHGDGCLADFGLAAYGNLQITFKGRVAAGKFTVRLGEKLGTNGKIGSKPPGSVNFREIEVMTVEGENLYKLQIPTKKPHQGSGPVKMPDTISEVTPFRYVEIEKSPLPLDKESLRQLAVNAPFDDKASSFDCSDPTLNAVWNLCKHTMKATTAFGVYIDGERERLPYEGDAYINLLSHYACDLDPRVARSTFERLLEHPTWPTEWSLQMPMIAEADYQATGDPVLAEKHFDAIKGKLLMNKAREDGLLRVSAIVDWPQGERDNYNEGVADPKERKQVGPEVNTVANAFYHQALRCTARLASALKKDGEARDLEAKAEQIRTAFNATFFDPKRGIYVDGEGSAHASLHANMFALAFDLVPSERRSKVADFVESRGMACSVYGAQFLLEALYQSGREDHALGLMTARTERSWWHMIELGSTMTLEAWDANAKPNLTWNHAWGAAPGNIISRYVLGVRPLEPGYPEILIAPQPGTLKWARGKVPTPHGPVGVSWRNEGLEIEVPPGSTARVVLPGPAAPGGKVSVDGKTVDAELKNGSLVIGGLAAGRHVILRVQK